MRKKKSQEYSPEEFDAVVATVQNDKSMRDAVERITGQKITGKTPREIFDLVQTLQKTTEVQATVAMFGRAKLALLDTARELEGVDGVLGEIKVKNTEIAELQRELREVRGQKRAIESQHQKELRSLENKLAEPSMAVYAEGTGR
jgi:hypothetical protein